MSAVLALQPMMIGCNLATIGAFVAAEAANILGIPFGSSYRSVKRSRNKYLTRTYVKNAGIASPKFFIFKTVAELKEGAEQIARYEEMYIKLFDEITKVIEVLQEVQQKTEDIYVRT